ncbi:mycofactocin biosynthesis peptidyl-dipeptidase MftE [Amycolatopsis endophytica]|uniref:Creatinine amidohydrolase n=1 Tax=Amycolatopsis endophytica TaxID=860233 RepID=A0A853B664_9PSEU|nr:mycofactocin biosynthesis peptidyl-dipeptidase MftE [Amycolatopsis endophytica]NYI90480.1 creatinine amidohydrolase [Amycolatopsis endophytica]
MNLADLAWPELGARRLLAVPLGAVEQHGPHLPYTVDTEIATELCRRLGHQRPEIVVAPGLPYGSSGEHAGFPGTLSIGQEATELVVTELVRSADDFAGVLLVSAHGGNALPVHRAVRRLRYEGRNVRVWSPDGPAGDTHAGHLETSVMLALRPESVRTHRFQAGNTEPLPGLIDRLRAEGVRGVSPNGVLGDPHGASAETGHATLRRWTEALLEVAATLAEDGIM